MTKSMTWMVALALVGACVEPEEGTEPTDPTENPTENPAGKRSGQCRWRWAIREPGGAGGWPGSGPGQRSRSGPKCCGRSTASAR